MLGHWEVPNLVVWCSLNPSCLHCKTQLLLLQAVVTVLHCYLSDCLFSTMPWSVLLPILLLAIHSHITEMITALFTFPITPLVLGSTKTILVSHVPDPLLQPVGQSFHPIDQEPVITSTAILIWDMYIYVYVRYQTSCQPSANLYRLYPRSLSAFVEP